MKEQIILDLDNYIGTGNLDFYTKLLQIISGGYGEGDILLGISSPNLRKIARKYYKEMSYDDIKYFLSNSYHEYRLFAVMCMTLMMKKHPDEIYELYINNLNYINNWDLVDISCPFIVGEFLKNRDEKESVIKCLYDSDNLWYRRIAIVSTSAFIKNNDLDFCLKFYKTTINDSHHLNNKALGWMLREIGKKDKNLLIDFLKNNKVSNITFNYAKEKLSKDDLKNL